MVRSIKKIFAGIALCACIALSAGAETFNSNISAEELRRLHDGEIVIRYINASKKACIADKAAPELLRIKDMLKDLRPNYLCEILFSVPVAGNGNIMEQLQSVFEDIDLYKKILYQPENSDSMAYLFSQAQLLAKTKRSGMTDMSALFQMEPLTPYEGTLHLEKKKDSFLFLHSNTDRIYFRNIKIISPQKMNAGLAAVRDGNRWLIYAVGALDAWKPFFMKKTLESMFNSRMKDFSAFYLQHIDVKK